MTRRNSQRAFVLAGVLVLIVLASMVAVAVLFRLQAEETATSAGVGSEQAWAAAMSGIAEAIRVAQATPAGLSAWEDDPAAFKDKLAYDDGTERWYFSIFRRGNDLSETTQYGLSDEASRLNIHNAKEDSLAKLPRLTPYLVQGLLDWLDRDDLPHPEGAEQEYYDALSKPYRIFNGPLSSIEELALIRGFGSQVLYGEDANLNGRLDLNEDDSSETFPPDNGDGHLDVGLREHVTIYSYDLNESSEGVARMDVNDPNENFIELAEPLAAYVAALRRNKVRLTNITDLLEAKATLKDENGKDVAMESGVTKTELAKVLDSLTASGNLILPGLINVNTASADVLQTLPEVDLALAESIVSARKQLRPEQRRTPAWLYEDELVDADLFKKIAPHLTTRSYQFRAQVIGYGMPSGRYRVLEATFDIGRGKPAILYLRDITRFGMPIPLQPAPREEPNA